MNDEKWLKTYLEDRFKGVDHRFDKMERQLESLSSWRWQMAGAAGILGVILAIIVKSVFGL